MARELLRRIDGALRRGETIDAIDEHVITPAPITEEQRAALWLYAFARTKRTTQRRCVREQLAQAGLS